jgi:hypothetical protein
MLVESSPSVELSEGPALASENQIRCIVAPATNSFGEADNLKWHLLFSRATDLLPLQGNKDGAVTLGGNRIHFVWPAANPRTDNNLRSVSVPAPFKRREDHRFKHTAGSSIAWCHRLRSANTSLAGVRSPVQLIRRGASRNRRW